VPERSIALRAPMAARKKPLCCAGFLRGSIFHFLPRDGAPDTAHCIAIDPAHIRGFHMGNNSTDPVTLDDDDPALRDDDELIDLETTCALMGGVALSTVYADEDLMALRLYLTAGDGRGKAVRLIKRRVLNLRRRRAAQSNAEAEKVRALVERRRELRRERQRTKLATSDAPGRAPIPGPRRRGRPRKSDANRASA
jgi:hypothetical protein